MVMLLETALPRRSQVWTRIFAEANEPIVCGEAQVADPRTIRYLACWVPPKDLSIYPNLEVVLSVGAGVDQMPALPENVKLCRTLASGISEKVRDWTVMATLMLYRGMPTYLDQAKSGEWRPHEVPLARDGRIGILGMGRIGHLVAKSLASLGFQISGCSRSGRDVADVKMFPTSRIDAFLTKCDILICLLPLTPESEGVLNADLFSKLPRGASLVHAGRGPQIDMDALRQALDSNRLSSAMLDVTSPEPLPEDHWAWRDPRVMITPHVASNTDEREGAEHALAVIQACRAGLPPPGLVDPQMGY